MKSKDNSLSYFAVLFDLLKNICKLFNVIKVVANNSD